MWVQSLAWELPYAAGAAVKKKKKKNTLDKQAFFLWVGVVLITHHVSKYLNGIGTIFKLFVCLFVSRKSSNLAALKTLQYLPYINFPLLSSNRTLVIFGRVLWAELCGLNIHMLKS